MKSAERGRYLAVVRAAFQLLFQVDLRGGRDAEEVFALSGSLPGGAGWRAGGRAGSRAAGDGGPAEGGPGRALGAVEAELARRGLLPMDLDVDDGDETGGAVGGGGRWSQGGGGKGGGSDSTAARPAAGAGGTGGAGGVGRWDQDEGVRREAFELAGAAWRQRIEADKELRRLAPAWPAHRQPAVDRAILRLGWALIVRQGAAVAGRAGAGAGGPAGHGGAGAAAVAGGAGGTAPATAGGAPAAASGTGAEGPTHATAGEDAAVGGSAQADARGTGGVGGVEEVGGVGAATLDQGACVAAIDACVDLAAVYSTEKSPAFVNALLDKVYQRVRGAGGA